MTTQDPKAFGGACTSDNFRAVFVDGFKGAIRMYFEPLTPAFWRRVEDRLLERLQRRCQHPDDMVVVDALEGCGCGVEIKYCRRCGAMKPVFLPRSVNVVPSEWEWRRPLPTLWHGLREDRQHER